jgi:hypothetical protein
MICIYPSDYPFVLKNDILVKRAGKQPQLIALIRGSSGEQKAKLQWNPSYSFTAH